MYVPDELDDKLPPLGEEAQQAAEDALRVLNRVDERVGANGQYLNQFVDSFGEHIVLDRGQSSLSEEIGGGRTAAAGQSARTRRRS
ncbi:hypothetical protein GCM10027562_14740 [Arthrobacter pigmenti]